ncbi:unnamed protein product [Rhizoctonia solani]|uniref:Uncharacterized protein n=1 Tax=Rhizoctonia solani TaxID=456999 RepID=A0A8H3A879_9AGAM|nr:unnamed protein product [Rhizoctonia solani]
MVRRSDYGLPSHREQKDDHAMSYVAGWQPSGTNDDHCSDQHGERTGYITFVGIEVAAVVEVGRKFCIRVATIMYIRQIGRRDLEMLRPIVKLIRLPGKRS